MTDDVRIATGFRHHPKTRKLRRRLGPEGCWALVCLFLWAGEERWSGDLSGLSDEDIELAADWEGTPDAFVATLVEVKFLSGEPGERKIHDWAVHNPFAAAKGERIARSKKGAAAKWGEKKAPNEHAKTRAQRLAAAREKGTHTQEQWEALVAFCGAVCVRCGAGGPLVKDHITPIYQGGSDGIDNLQPLCRTCNCSKGPEDIDHRPAGWEKCLLDACPTPALRLVGGCDSEKNASPPAPTPPPSFSKSEEQKPSARRAARQEDEGRFPDWWEVYPKHVKRKNALAIWQRRKLDLMADQLIADVVKRVDGDDRWKQGYVPDPTTYLNQDRWDDDLCAAPRERTPAPAAPSKTFSLIQKLEGMKHGLAGNRTSHGPAEVALLGTGTDPRD